MNIQDSVTGWFVQKFVMPRSQVFDSPGFVSMKITGKKEDLFVREAIMPESFFVNVENEVVNRFGDNGRQRLYSAGKKFGYGYVSVGNFPTIKSTSEKDFLNFVFLLIRYTEGTYAKRIAHKVILEKFEIDLELYDYVICNKSGHGYFLSSGGAAGIWSKLMEDPSVEGTQIQCQGKGVDNCVLICAPAQVLAEKSMSFFKETNVGNLEIDSRYSALNKFRKTKFSQNSFQRFLQSKIFNYENGVINGFGERFFLCELTGVYLIEFEVAKLSGGDEILFEAAFQSGVSVAQHSTSKNPGMFIQDLLCSLGWGDVFVQNKGGLVVVNMDFFPWTKFSETSSFLFIRGFASGLCSFLFNRSVKLKNFKSTTIQGFLFVSLSE